MNQETGHEGEQEATLTLRDKVQKAITMRDIETEISSLEQSEKCFDKFLEVCDEIDSSKIEEDEYLQNELLGLIDSINDKYFKLEGNRAGAHPIMAGFISKCINRSIDSRSRDLLLERIFSYWEKTQYLASYFVQALGEWERGNQEKKLNIIQLYMGREQSYCRDNEVENPREILNAIGRKLEKEMSPSEKGPVDGNIPVENSLEGKLKEIYLKYLEKYRVESPGFFESQMEKFIDKGYFLGGIEWACEFLKIDKYFYPGSIGLTRMNINTRLVQYIIFLKGSSKAKYFIEKMNEVYDEKKNPEILEYIFKEWLSEYEQPSGIRPYEKVVPVILEFFKNKKSYKNAEFMIDMQQRFLELHEYLQSNMTPEEWKKEEVIKEIAKVAKEGSKKYLKDPQKEEEGIVFVELR